MEYLEKHCTISKDGVIALSNTLVELAIKVHNCPIKVTCSDYPGQVATYTIDDLLKPKFTAGPYPDQYNEGCTYSLCMYPWQGVDLPANSKVEVKTEEANSNLACPPITVEKRGKSYIIRTPVIVTTFEEKKVFLAEYVGSIIHQTRKARGLSQMQLSNLIEGKASGSNIGQIENGLTNPILSTLEAISDALGLHITDLFPPKHG